MTLHPVLIAISPTAPAKTPESVEQQREYAKLALSHCAALSAAPADGWRSDADGRPLPNEGFYWSVSHKRHWAAAAIADRAVGIDIEHVLPRREALLDELATHDEWGILGDRSWHSFFRLWTAKEAVLKANGVGIACFSMCRLLKVPSLHHMTLRYRCSDRLESRSHKGASWHVEHCYLSDHIAAVACNDADMTWHMIEGKRQNIETSKHGNQGVSAES